MQHEANNNNRNPDQRHRPPGPPCCAIMPRPTDRTTNVPQVDNSYFNYNIVPPPYPHSIPSSNPSPSTNHLRNDLHGFGANYTPPLPPPNFLSLPPIFPFKTDSPPNNSFNLPLDPTSAPVALPCKNDTGNLENPFGPPIQFDDGFFTLGDRVAKLEDEISRQKTESATVIRNLKMQRETASPPVRDGIESQPVRDEIEKLKQNIRELYRICAKLVERSRNPMLPTPRTSISKHTFGIEEGVKKDGEKDPLSPDTSTKVPEYAKHSDRSSAYVTDVENEYGLRLAGTDSGGNMAENAAREESEGVLDSTSTGKRKSESMESAEHEGVGEMRSKRKKYRYKDIEKNTLEDLENLSTEADDSTDTDVLDPEDLR